MARKFEVISLPKEITEELNKINWEKVTEKELNFLRTFIPILKTKGYFKNEKAQKNNS